MITDLNNLPIGLFSRLVNCIFWGSQNNKDGPINYENDMIAALSDSTPEQVGRLDPESFILLSQLKDDVIQSFVPAPILNKSLTINNLRLEAMINPAEWTARQSELILSSDVYYNALPERIRKMKCLTGMTDFLGYIYVKKRPFRKVKFDERLLSGDAIVEYRISVIDNISLGEALGVYFHLINHCPDKLPQIVKDLPGALPMVKQTLPGITLPEAMSQIINAFKSNL